VSGIESILQNTDYTMVLASVGENPEREQACLNMLRGENVPGVIFTPTVAQSGDYRVLQRSGVQLVAISRRPRDKGVDFVTVDNEVAAFEATRHLISHGHKRIAFIGGPRGVSSTEERLAGFSRAMADAGLQVLSQFVRFGDFRERGGYQATSEILDLPTLPTALFSGSNLTTLGVLRAIHERKLGIPDEIALIAFDDMPWGASLQPPLTAVAQPTFEIGQVAAKLLLARLQAPSRPVEMIVLPTRLVVRASCGHASDNSPQWPRDAALTGP
jgi:LacI family transcriptional regulator